MNQIYDASENWNKPTIWIDKSINKIVNWKKRKEEECKTKVLNKFIKKIIQFKEYQNDNIDIQENILEVTGYKLADNKKKLDDLEKMRREGTSPKDDNFKVILIFHINEILKYSLLSASK